MYQAGELDQRVTFRRATLIPDGYGGSSKSWADIVTVWAKVRPLSGSERAAADRLNAESRLMIVIRSRSDLLESDIAVWNGRQFNIRYIKPKPRDPWLEIEVDGGVAV